MALNADEIGALFTQPGGDFLCARWARPIAPVAFGLADETLAVFRAALAAVEAAIRPGETVAVWVETPTNPLLKLVDIAAIAAIARQRGILVVVDNTSRPQSMSISLKIKRSEEAHV